MIVRKQEELKDMDRKVSCPNGGFISYRFLLESDGMGYSLTKTVIPKGDEQFWHYKNHLESCLCISGEATLTNAVTGEEHPITPDTIYILDKNDAHLFKAHETTVLICIFNPPLKGKEVHREDGSYE